MALKFRYQRKSYLKDSGSTFHHGMQQWCHRPQNVGPMKLNVTVLWYFRMTRAGLTSYCNIFYVVSECVAFIWCTTYSQYTLYRQYCQRLYSQMGTLYRPYCQRLYSQMGTSGHKNAVFTLWKLTSNPNGTFHSHLDMQTTSGYAVMLNVLYCRHMKAYFKTIQTQPARWKFSSAHRRWRQC